MSLAAYQQRTGAETQLKLRRVAERLFSEFGIDAVSPRQIALEAGQRNESAIGYHFGTKDDLVNAIHLERMTEINIKRRAILADMHREGRMQDLRALVGAIAIPLIEKVNQHPEDAYYAGFLAHLFADRRRRNLAIAQGDEAAVLRSVFDAMRTIVPDFPATLWTERLRLTVGCIVNGIADRTRLKAAGDRAVSELLDAAFTENLFDSAVAILQAPVSAATEAALRPHNNPVRKEG